MTRRVLAACAAALALAGVGAAGAEPASAGLSNASATPAILGGIDVASDTDGFHATRFRAGGLYPYVSYFDYAGVALQATHYSQAGWDREASGVVGLWRRQDPRTLAGIDAKVGVVQVAGHTRAIGDATWSLRPATDTGVELIAAGDLVETPKAIERGIAYGLFAASVEHTFAERFTAIGFAGYQPFTDGNSRTQLRARLIWQAVPAWGLNTEFRWRQYRSSKDDVGGAYFNPDRYRQWVGALSMRRHTGSWTLSGALGAGRETIDGSDTHPVRMAELRAEGALSGNLRLVAYASYNRSTGYVDAPDYSYRQVGFTLIRAF
ncbi:MAG: hypothetical protein ACYC9Z_01940 [Casimicrobiaceae bacterium]